MYLTPIEKIAILESSLRIIIADIELIEAQSKIRFELLREAENGLANLIPHVKNEGEVKWLEETLGNIRDHTRYTDAYRKRRDSHARNFVPKAKKKE